MSVILGIDPGRTTGWCFITSQGVVDCGVVQVDPHSHEVFDHPVYQPDTVLFEHPQIYRPGESPGDPNNLLGMVFQVGRWWQHYGTLYRAKCSYVLPKEWKGQLLKDVCAQRVWDLLTESEQRVVSKAGSGLAKKPLLDMMDAVGIALHAAGRKLKR